MRLLIIIFAIVYSLLLNVHGHQTETLLNKCSRNIHNLMEWINIPSTFINGARYSNPDDSFTRSLCNMTSLASTSIVKEMLSAPPECINPTLTEPEIVNLSQSAGFLLEQISLLLESLAVHQAEIQTKPDLLPLVKDLISSVKPVLDFYLGWKISFRTQNYANFAFKIFQQKEAVNRAYGLSI